MRRFCLVLILVGCREKLADKPADPEAGASDVRSNVPTAEACFTEHERASLSLDRIYWSRGGLSYCIGDDARAAERCLEFDAHESLLKTTSHPPAEGTKLLFGGHPLDRAVIYTRSGLRVCDRHRSEGVSSTPARIGILDRCELVTGSFGSSPYPLRSEDADPASVQGLPQWADVSTDLHDLLVARGDTRVFERWHIVRPDAGGMARASRDKNAPLPPGRMDKVLWLGRFAAIVACDDDAADACHLTFMDTRRESFGRMLDPNVRIGHAAGGLMQGENKEWAAFDESGSRVVFFDIETGETRATLALPKRSSEGIYVARIAPYEAAVVYGKPSLGDIVRISLQRHALLNTYEVRCAR